MTAPHVTAAGRSDVGRVREHNEDAHLVGRQVFAVADGLGGHAAGEVASALAIATIGQVDEHEHPEATQAQEALRDAIVAANGLILEAAAADRSRAGMGTTLTAAVMVGDVCALAHVGDSRAYLWRDGDLRQLTADHSHVADLVRAGDLTPAEAREHPLRAIITRALGLDVDVEVDVPEPFALGGGDRLLLCSDGLTEPLEDARIAQMLSEADDPETACGTLVDAANAAGGPDNVTVVVVEA